MTEFELNCYGMSERDIQETYIDTLTSDIQGLEMVVMGMLSNCQEMLELGKDANNQRYSEYIRKQMNIAKYILSEMMDARETT